MRFTVSWAGVLMLALLFVPNLFWTKNRPVRYEEFVGNENRFLRLLERLGEIAVSALCLLDFCTGAHWPWSLWMAAALMLLYEIYWVRYFRSGRTMEDFYGSLWGIPVPGAVLPVAAFFALAAYERNLPLGIAVAVLGVGHIGIHANHRKEIL